MENESGLNSITLSRGQKSTYGWEIKVRFPVGDPSDQALEDIKTIDTNLRATYPCVNPENDKSKVEG